MDEATATECAAQVRESVASCSFHLRTPEKYGYIERAERRGREKPWRVRHVGSSLDARPDRQVPGSLHAVQELAALTVTREADRVARYLAQAADEPEEWLQAITVSTAGFWATAAELREHSEGRAEARPPVRRALVRRRPAARGSPARPSELTGSDGAAAVVFVMLGLPAVVAPVLGQVADRLSRRRLLVGSNLLLTGVVATLLLVDSASWLWLLYAVIVTYGAMGYLNAAAQSGLIRDLLPDEHLASGNGLLTSIDQSLRLVSPVLGTGLYALAGPRAVVVVTAVCFLLTAVVLLGVRVAELPPEAASERGSYLHEVSAGFRHLGRTPGLGRLTVLLAVACAAAGLVNAAVFPALEQGLGLPASALGALVSMQASAPSPVG